MYYLRMVVGPGKLAVAIKFVVRFVGGVILRFTYMAGTSTGL
jgi:hypothetical protein